MLKRWSRPYGYREVLGISLPLVASMGAFTLMQFTDRLFLAHYSVDAIAAALPAGIASFTFVSFFMGVGNYTNAFVAQYSGAGADHRIGSVLWQGIWFSIFSGVLLALLYGFSGHIFRFIGHSPQVRSLEISYFNILILGAGLVVAGSTMACFYTGRGLTWTVMVVNIAGAAVNIPLDYCLINGVGPFPEMGIRGAAIATVIAEGFIVLTLGILIFSRKNRERFGTWRNRRFDKQLFGRLMRYGVPSGVQFFLEVFGFTFFIQMLGRLGDLELAVSNIVFSIEALAFTPMVGFHIGNATLVGQAIGRGEPEGGVEATTNALHITLAYMIPLTVMFVWMPEPILSLFQSKGTTAHQYREIMDLGIILMRFVAIFCFFDALNLIYSGAIKGAGDTRFIMWTIGAVCLGIMVLPVYVAVEVFGAGLYTVWAFATTYACALGIAFMLRYRHGAWKRMRVIENISRLPRAESFSG